MQLIRPQQVWITGDYRVNQIWTRVDFFIDRKQIFDTSQYKQYLVSLEKFRQAIRNQAEVAQQFLLIALVAATSLAVEWNVTEPLLVIPPAEPELWS